VISACRALDARVGLDLPRGSGLRQRVSLSEADAWAAPSLWMRRKICSSASMDAAGGARRAWVGGSIGELLGALVAEAAAVAGGLSKSGFAPIGNSPEGAAGVSLGEGVTRAYSS
jgi:hypothetical protein